MGKIQKQDVKTVAELVGAGATAADLPNDDQVYVTAQGINKTLKDAISDGNIGAGGAGINYFSDANANNITNFVLYNDGGAVPTDGIGGTVSANLTRSLNTSTPIIGTSSYRASKAGAVNLQGHGFSLTTDKTLDAPVVAGQPVTIQFRYRTSAAYNSAQIRMFVYFVGPNSVQALSGISNDGVFTNDLRATGGSLGQFTATTSCPAGTTAIRLIAHIAGTETANYDIDFDEITIGTAATLTGPIVTEWVPYTPQWIGSTTNPVIGNGVIAGRWRRIGDSIEAQIQVTAGSTTTFGSGEYRFTLPDGFTFDTTKSPNSGAGDNSIIGYGKVVDVGSQVYLVQVERATATQFRPRFLTTAAGTNPVNVFASAAVNPTLPFTFGNSDIILLSITAPITQFANSTNVISSTQANFLSGSFRASRNGVDQTGVNPNNSLVKINFNSTASSTDYVRGGLVYDTTNSRFVASKRIRLRVSSCVSVNGANVLANAYTLFCRINNTTDVISGQTQYPPAGNSFRVILSGTVDMQAGDFIEIFLSGVGNNSINTLTVFGVAQATYFEAAEIPDLSVVGISGAPLEILGVTMDTPKTPSASAHWHNLTPAGSSITLTPGVWEVVAAAAFLDSGTTASYSYTLVRVGGANGADSSSAPAGITTVAGLTLLSQAVANLRETNFNPSTIAGDRKATTVIVQLTQTATIWVNTFAAMTTPTNARIFAAIQARRIR